MKVLTRVSLKTFRWQANFLYFGAAILSAFLFVFTASAGLYEMPQVFQFFEKRWNSVKQSTARRRWADQKFPSAQVELLTLSYDNRLEFWSDETTKRHLRKVLEGYRGPVVLGLDPVMLIRDSELHHLLDRHNIIRPYFVERADAREIDQARETLALASARTESKKLSIRSMQVGTSMRKLVPKQIDYYKTPFFQGFLEFHQDVSAQFVHTYPLTLAASIPQLDETMKQITATELRLSSPVLAAVTLLHHCKDYFYAQNRVLNLKNCGEASTSQSLGPFADPLPLFFYFRPFKKAELDELSPEQNSLLIVSVVDTNSYFPSAVGTKTSWSEVVATAVSNILQTDMPWRNNMVRWSELLIFIMALSIICISTLLRKLQSCISGVLICTLGVILIDFGATIFFNIYTHPIAPFLGLAFVSTIAIATRSIVDTRERQLFERALSGYVSPERLQRLLSGDENLSLGGRLKTLTMILIDIVGFHKTAQKMKIEEVFKMMQNFFSIVDSIIFKYGGTIDKKTGDGLLAFFGDAATASDKESAKAAVLAGIEIQYALRSISLEELGSVEPVKLRIGINTGEVMIGNTGSEQHFDYTMLGTEVNFTQRLEAACPPGEVLIGMQTADLVRDHFALEEKQIQVKHESDLYRAYLVRQS